MKDYVRILTIKKKTFFLDIKKAFFLDIKLKLIENQPIICVYVRKTPNNSKGIKPQRPVEKSGKVRFLWFKRCCKVIEELQK